MIPKIIHYCWFGGNPLPESAKKCIASWRKFLPDYEIWQWSEAPLNVNVNDNDDALTAHRSPLNCIADKVMEFNVNIIPYTKEAYEAKKYAFVSDYARYDILHQYGGVYFDTDVEVIAPMDDIIEKGPYMGIEVPAKEEVTPMVNPGLGIGAPAGLPFYKKVLDYYSTLHFLGEDGKPNEVTIVTHTSKVLAESGMNSVNEIQQVAGIWIYPVDYFNPLNDLTGKIEMTQNTRSIHWYSKTWLNQKDSMRNKITRILHRFFGVEFVHKVGNLFR